MSAEQGKRYDLPYNTLGEMVEFWGHRDPHKPVFVFVDKHRSRYELSRRQVYELSGRWSSVLRESGVSQGDLVVSTLSNGPERALCDVGIIMAGAVTVNAHCQLADGSDLLRTLQESKASVICVNPDLTSGPWSVLQQHVQHDPATHTITSTTLSHLRHVFFIRRKSPLSQAENQIAKNTTGDGEERTDSSEEKKAGELKNLFSSLDCQDFIAGLQNMNTVYRAEVEADEIAYVFLTSGSTGFSKLVPVSHNCMLEIHRLAPNTNIDQFSMDFNMAPLGWLGGFCFTSLNGGKGRVLLDAFYGMPDDLPSFIWDVIAQEECSTAVFTPFLVHKVSESANVSQWKLKTIYLGGQPAAKRVIEKGLQLADRVFVGYGSTEMLFVSAAGLADVSQFQDFMVGKPLFCNVVKICDEDGREVERGTRGEVYVKTPYMLKSYVNAPAPITPDGFLKTGDIGWLQDDDMLFVEGRHPDIIHRGSYIFYPGWLEHRILLCCPGLQEVMVVGVPDPDMGQELCACFVPSDPSVSEHHVRQTVEKDIVTSVSDPLSPRPRYYLTFTSFPKTFTDKPARNQLRKLAAERLALC